MYQLCLYFFSIRTLVAQFIQSTLEFKLKIIIFHMTLSFTLQHQFFQIISSAQFQPTTSHINNQNKNMSSQIQTSFKLTNIIKQVQHEKFSQMQQIESLYSKEGFSNIFMKKVDMLKKKKVIYLGLLLKQGQIKQIFKQMFENCKKLLNQFEKMDFRSKETNIYFFPLQSYQIFKTEVIILYYPEHQLQDLCNNKYNLKILQLFLLFPQILIFNNQLYATTTKIQSIMINIKSINQFYNLQQHLRTRQYLVICQSTKNISNNYVDIDDQIPSPSIEHLNKIILIGFRKNAHRCINHSYKIYLYFYQNYLNIDLNAMASSNSNYLIDQVSKKYIFEEIYRNYDELKIKLKDFFPMDEQQLKNKLRKQQELAFNILIKNFQLFSINNQQKMKQIKFDLQNFNSQLIEDNKKQVQKYNITLLKTLSQQLLYKIKNSAVRSITTSTTLSTISTSNNNENQISMWLAEDLSNMLQNYAKQALYCTNNCEKKAPFMQLNKFMCVFKTQYYEEVSDLLVNSQGQKQKKNENQDLQMEIQIKSRVLWTLETELAKLEGKKSNLQKQNQKLKIQSQKIYNQAQQQREKMENIGKNNINQMNSQRQLIQANENTTKKQKNKQTNHNNNKSQQKCCCQLL